MINPAIVEGQIRGGVAQGIGGVLLRARGLRRRRPVPGRHVHGLPAADDDRGAPLSRSTTSRSPPHRAPSNFRGVGEGGAIGAPAALTNAIEDALAPLGVKITEQYLPPTRILELIGAIARE